jgi:hypothetical protein
MLILDGLNATISVETIFYATPLAAHKIFHLEAREQKALCEV